MLKTLRVALCTIIAGAALKAQAQLVTYTVTIKTADVSNAGTIYHNFFTLAGTKGTSAETAITGSSGKGESKSYDITPPGDLGKITSVTLRVENDGGLITDDWQVEWVEVVRKANGSPDGDWYFNFAAVNGGVVATGGTLTQPYGNEKSPIAFDIKTVPNQTDAANNVTIAMFAKNETNTFQTVFKYSQSQVNTISSGFIETTSLEAGISASVTAGYSSGAAAGANVSATVAASINSTISKSNEQFNSTAMQNTYDFSFNASPQSYVFKKATFTLTYHYYEVPSNNPGNVIVVRELKNVQRPNLEEVLEIPKLDRSGNVVPMNWTEIANNWLPLLDEESRDVVNAYHAIWVQRGYIIGNITNPNLGRNIRLAATGSAGSYIKNVNGEAHLQTVTSAADKQNAAFKVVAGLNKNCDNCVSFESVNQPGYFLRHSYFYLVIDKNDGSDLFAEDATFGTQKGLSGTGVSFETSNYPGNYITIEGDRLKIAPNAETSDYYAIASFNQVTLDDNLSAPGDVASTSNTAQTNNAMPAAGPKDTLQLKPYFVNIQPLSISGSFVHFTSGGAAQVMPLSSQQDIGNITIRIVKSLNTACDSCVSFELGLNSGLYLRHSNYYLRFDKNDNSELFSRDASFVTTTGLTGSGYSYIPSNYPGYFIKVEGTGLKIAQYDSSDEYKSFATFFEMEPGTAVITNANSKSDVANAALNPNNNNNNVSAAGKAAYLVNIQAVSNPGNFVRCTPDGSAQVSQLSNSLDMAAATINVAKSLVPACSACVSFQSWLHKGFYLHPVNNYLRFDRYDSSEQFTRDAVFLTVPGLTGQGYSYQMRFKPGYYIAVDNNVLKVAKNDESDTFKTKATFVELAPNPGNIQAGGTVVATPHNYLVNINLLQQQGMFIKCNIDGTVQLSQLTSDDDKKNGTFNIIAGLDANIKNAVSFQVYSYGQYYLKNQNGALKVDKLKNTATFNTNATFVTVQGLAGNGYSYEAANQPGHYIVADNGVLKISKDDGSAAFNKAATFMEMPLEPKPQAPVKK